MTVRDIIRSKGSEVVTVQPDMTVTDLVGLLRDKNIGSVLVSKDGKNVEGIVSERDVILELANKGAQVLASPVSDIMATKVIVCSVEDSTRHVMEMMTLKRIRHVPVFENDQLAGIVSIGDIVKNRLEESELEANVLRDIAIGSR